MKLEKSLSYLFRALVFFTALFAVVYALLKFEEVFAKFRTLYFLTGEWYDLILIAIFAMALGYLLKWLVKWEYHIESGHRRHK
jgi:predicted ABC-type exoprotein transport system permease subunit